MANSECQNCHFEKMAAWLQILQIVGNSTLIYLWFDTHDSPGAFFIQKWEIFSPDVPVCIAALEATEYEHPMIVFFLIFQIFWSISQRSCEVFSGIFGSIAKIFSLCIFSLGLCITKAFCKIFYQSLGNGFGFQRIWVLVILCPQSQLKACLKIHCFFNKIQSLL